MPGTIVPLPVMLEEEDRKVYEQLKPPSSIVVRYGYARLIAELSYDGQAKPGCGSKMVIRTPRGTEIGEMLTSTCPNAGCTKSITRKQMLQYIENSGGKDFPFTGQGKVLRMASGDDLTQQAKIDSLKGKIIKIAKALIVEMALPMRLIEIEQLLGGERIVFHYTADQWVDFRELVRRLAKQYHTRIEMHQVNAREEARLVADYERCGQHCCCRQFLKVLKPVSMRSAKVQKATLDPTKISGRCGRLMCCLRYEDQTYETLRKRLPHRNNRVRTEDGEGVVIGTQVLTQLVMVKLDQPGKPAAYPLESIEVLGKQGGKKSTKRPPAKDAAVPRTAPESKTPSQQAAAKDEQAGERKSRPGVKPTAQDDQPSQGATDATPPAEGQVDKSPPRGRRRRRRGRGRGPGSASRGSGNKPD